MHFLLKYSMMKINLKKKHIKFLAYIKTLPFKHTEGQKSLNFSIIGSEKYL